MLAGDEGDGVGRPRVCAGRVPPQAELAGQVTWGEIDSFASTTGGLASPEIVTLRTTSGRKVMTQIPSRLLPELESYATEHGFHGS